MEDKKLVEEAFGEALKDSEKEKKEKIKKIILETLRKKVGLEEEVKELQKKIKILGKDLEDFKQGRLDLIEERQKVDELAQKTSVIWVEKVIEHHYYPNVVPIQIKPWYEPYQVTWGRYWDNDTSGTRTMDGSSVFPSISGMASFSLNASGTDFHNFYSGSYDVGSRIINL